MGEMCEESHKRKRKCSVCGFNVLNIVVHVSGKAFSFFMPFPSTTAPWEMLHMFLIPLLRHLNTPKKMKGIKLCKMTKENTRKG
jgi:hypothetical protein